MEIINASRAKKLNSQITCTSYYDFLTKQRQWLEALDCTDMQPDPPCKAETEDPLCSATDRAKYYDVSDNAAEWYLGTRALPVTSPLVSQCKMCSKYHPLRHARPRRLKPSTYSAPGRRVSPEFLSLLKQHHATSMRKSRRPTKVSFSYYKYDAEGKRRHMRPGIDTAAPLEFPNPMDKDDPEYRKLLLLGQEFRPAAPLSPKPSSSSKRVVRQRDSGSRFKGNQEKAKDTFQKTKSLKDLNDKETDHHQGHTFSNPSVHECIQPKSLRDQLRSCTCPLGQGVIQGNRRTKDPFIFILVKNAFKAIQKRGVGERLRNKGPKQASQFSFNGNNGMKLSPSGQEVLNGSICVQYPVNSCQKIDPKDKSNRKIFRTSPCSKASACNSDFCRKKKQQSASFKYPTERNSAENNLNSCKLNSKTMMGQEKSTLEKGKEKRSTFSCNIPDKSESHSSSTLNLDQLKSVHHLKINQSQQKPDYFPNCSTEQKPIMNTEIRNTCKCSGSKPQVPPKKYNRRTCTRLTQKTEQTETSSPEPEMIPGITEPTSIPQEGEEEKVTELTKVSEVPEKPSNSPDKCGKPASCNRSSCTRIKPVAEPCSGSHLKTNQSKDKPSNNRIVEKSTANTETRNGYPCSKPRVPPKEDFDCPRQWNTCKRSNVQKEQTETSSPEPKMIPDVTEQTSIPEEGEEEKVTELTKVSEKPSNSPDNCGRPASCNRSSCNRDKPVAEPCSHLKTNQSKDKPSNNRIVEKSTANTETRNAYPFSKPRVPPKQDFNCPRQWNTYKRSNGQKEQTETNSFRSKTNDKNTRQEASRLPEREEKKPNLSSNSPEKNKKKVPIHPNGRKVEKPRVTPNKDCNCNRKTSPVRPMATKRLVNNDQNRKCGTYSRRDYDACVRNFTPELHRNFKRCPTKPIPIRCDQTTKKCVPFPHSSGNEKTDLKRWLSTRPDAVRRKKVYTKTSRCRAKRKCYESDTSASSDPDRRRQRMDEWWTRRESCCRCPFCCSVIPPRCDRYQEVQFPSAFRGQEYNQRCCSHRKRWHCKETRQETSQEYFPYSGAQTSYASRVSQQFPRYCGSRRMRGGVDFRENDDSIPRRNRDAPHSFSTSLSSDSDSYQQVRYTKPRMRSRHTFGFD